MFDMKKLKTLLVEDGLNPKLFPLFTKQLNNNMIDLDHLNIYEDVIKKGFFPGQVEKYKLTEDNIQEYLSTYVYFKLHPLNNFFSLWINDKLTLKYFLSGAGLIDALPEYYLYIENDGTFTYLVDAPTDIENREEFLWELLKEKKVLAAKPNNGAGSNGFLKYEVVEDRVLRNNKKISKRQYLKETARLYNYVFTEYLQQHKDLKKIWDGSEAVIRCNMYKLPRNTSFSLPQWRCVNAYIVMGTVKSGTASNEGRDAVCVPIDYDTGLLGEQGVYHIEENMSWDRISEHPNTGFGFKNYNLPDWDDTKNVIMKSCDALSSLEWLGLDLIITDKGAKICEINSLPGIEMPQMICGPILKDEMVKKYFQKKGLAIANTGTLFDIIMSSFV